MVEKTGTMPNAFCIPGPSFYNEDGTVKGPEQLREMFTSKGVDVEKPMAFSCGAGVMAAVGLVCSEKAGFSGQKYLFDGSWAEWSAKQPKE